MHVDEAGFGAGREGVVDVGGFRGGERDKAVGCGD